MRKIAYLIAFASIVAVIYLNGATRAENQMFAERFSADTKYKGESGAYSFDKAHSFIGFKVKHMGLIEVPGFFRDFTGQWLRTRNVLSCTRRNAIHRSRPRR